MSIGFLFTASIRRKDAFWKTLDSLSHRLGYSFQHEGAWGSVRLCPMGEISFRLEQEKTGTSSSYKLTADCTTSLAGAGFHAVAVDFTDCLVKEAKLKISMEDETEYYELRDFSRMRQEHFYYWLSNLIHICSKQEAEGTLSNPRICWDVDQYMPEDIPGSVVTPVGRFHIATLMDQLQNEGIEPFAEEFFTWNQRERDARYYRNSALSLQWEHCYFMPGSRSQEDEEVNEAILSLLERAVQMDPSLPIPKAEYAFLCQLQNHEPMDLDSFADYSAEYPIGYRRGDVTYRLGNTDLSIPGCFLKDDDDGGMVWYSGDEKNWRNLRASAFTSKEGDAEFSPRLFADCSDRVIEFKAKDGSGRCAYAGPITDEDGAVYHQSISQIICKRQTTLITASFEAESDQEWALSFFRKIKAFEKIGQ